jgi:hypothetical protein
MSMGLNMMVVVQFKPAACKSKKDFSRALEMTP